MVSDMRLGISYWRVGAADCTVHRPAAAEVNVASGAALWGQGAPRERSIRPTAGTKEDSRDSGSSDFGG